jgi:parallel beta-helix repeat protein
MTDIVLDRDLMGCRSNGIVIGADNVTLDLNGHTIAGDGALVDCPDGAACDRGVDNSQGHTGVTVKDGAITGFGIGVWVEGAAATSARNLTTSDNAFLGILVIGSTETVLTGNVVLRNGVGNDGAGIAVVGSENSHMQRNTVRGNGSQGLQVVGGSDHSVIAHNEVTDNLDAGIGVDGNDNQITRNIVSRNGDDIIVAGDHNVAARNLVSDAVGCADNGCGFGISFEHGVGNRFSRNLVTRARTGIRVDAFGSQANGTIIDRNIVRDASVDGIAINPEHAGPVSDTLVSRNTVSGAGDDGIDVESPSTTLTRNVAVRNGDLGIEAEPGVQDGGDNRAAGNGNPDQCTGVTCTGR